MTQGKIACLAHLDGLRAIAVTIVLLFHLEIDWFKGGFVGGDVFCVIGAYLITKKNGAQSDLTYSGTLHLRKDGSRYLIRKLLPTS